MSERTERNARRSAEKNMKTRCVVSNARAVYPGGARAGPRSRSRAARRGTARGPSFLRVRARGTETHHVLLDDLGREVLIDGSHDGRREGRLRAGRGGGGGGGRGSSGERARGTSGASEGGRFAGSAPAASRSRALVPGGGEGGGRVRRSGASRDIRGDEPSDSRLAQTEPRERAAPARAGCAAVRSREKSRKNRKKSARPHSLPVLIPRPPRDFAGNERRTGVSSRAP